MIQGYEPGLPVHPFINRKLCTVQKMRNFLPTQKVTCLLSALITQCAQCVLITMELGLFIRSKLSMYSICCTSETKNKDG